MHWSSPTVTSFPLYDFLLGHIKYLFTDFLRKTWRGGLMVLGHLDLGILLPSQVGHAGMLVVLSYLLCEPCVMPGTFPPSVTYVPAAFE